MRIPLIMTPGPTSVRENVRLARSLETTNPDIDLDFYEFYKETCERLAQFLNTSNEVRIMSGEGILGLEAACASLTERGDRVLVIDNGIFGEGFGDFVTMYGGEPIYFKGDRQRKLDIEELRAFLDVDSDFKYATVVHCDTPSGVLNDIESICKLLKRRNIMTVVDSVAAMGGEELRVDDWKIDIALGASQKVVSAPPGLTFLSISEDAFKAMENRKTPVASFYCNLLIWKDYYDKKWFPYTMPISDIYGLRTAIDNILSDVDVLDRHSRIANAVRKAVLDAGLHLYIQDGNSNTVTVIQMPIGVKSNDLRYFMKEKYNVLIAGSFGYLTDKVIRIGHMGENAYSEKVSYALYALEESLRHFGFECKKSLIKTFFEEYSPNPGEM